MQRFFLDRVGSLLIFSIRWGLAAGEPLPRASDAAENSSRDKEVIYVRSSKATTRTVPMYYPDPAEVLRRLARHLRPGGIIAFQEADTPASRADATADL
jgi:SAM-dependent methyltransferase